ncbi:MAG: hypothetical protein JNK36_01200 [Bacteroidia bacterium]|nr:hypothetical protein [Bacteroidia bacterium]HRA73424.1 hypothetical protein [Flavobacterium sp.]MBP7714433.1 hypothetical protein [Bacteroidia bacterium]MBP8668554.1 hypothetical protein [Bacteroidia bacterium]HQW18099.1 hypothetical protein [Bacteroidia bacterium]
MKKRISLALLILIAGVVNGQSNNPAPNGFANFNEFSHNTPSMTLNFSVKQRTQGNVFMTGGITNYRLENIQPKSDKEKLEKEVWGVMVHDTVYINSYPYSKVKGYNQIIDKGYYTYFIGEPARTEKEQRDLGIIKPTESQIAVCCQAGYVISPDGTIKLLRPELLSELCKDNEEISKEIAAAKLKLEDVHQMFACLKKYNATKK